MSFYRGWKPSLNYQPESKRDHGPVTTPQPAPVHLRKAQPLQTLLPRTAIWIASLPRPVRPYELAARFPRIANQLCATWNHPLECRRYFDELLVDKRGNRKGFPPAVMADLLTLRRLHAEQHPTTDINWQIPRR